MTIQQYLEKYRSQATIVLVGPLYQPHDSWERFDEPVIFVDGGAHFRRDKEGYTLGDGDSYHDILDTSLNCEKDFSDLAFALNHLSPNFTHVTLLGFLGGRRDHEFFNFGEVQKFIQSHSPRTTVLFDKDVVAFSAGEWEFDVSGLFSLGALETTSFVMTGECKYQVPEPTKLPPLSSLGLSNFGHGTIKINCAGPMLLFINIDDSPLQHLVNEEKAKGK
ncbi:MAG: hypothetical protein GKR96_03555 [Gammaproteobacteria bacterium]|nr:hypothetical protein [Gammaproteobacteria bacterium]